MEFIRIVLAALGTAIGYGLVHDQITIRVSPEYFTIGHPHLIETSSLTVLALFWGVVATWWVGLPLGFFLASAARNGRRWPRLGLREIAPRLGKLVLVMFGLAAAAGCTTFVLVGPLGISLPGQFAGAIQPSAQRAFLAAWATHITSYLAGIVGGLVVVFSVLRERRRLAAFTNRW